MGVLDTFSGACKSFVEDWKEQKIYIAFFYQSCEMLDPDPYTG